jgi:site-specific DNA-methyltransferase (adenine-specific)
VNLGTVRHESVSKPLPFDAVRFIERAGFTFSWEIVWHKPAGGRRAARNFYRRPFAGSFIPNNIVEYVLVFKKRPDAPFATRSELLAQLDNAIVTDEVFRREISNNVWHLMPVREERLHPCPFPPEIPLRLITLLSLKGETVLDPFMGSGTTARAARMLGRHFVGYEVQDTFVELAKREVVRPLKTRRALLLRLEAR